MIVLIKNVKEFGNVALQNFLKGVNVNSISLYSTMDGDIEPEAQYGQCDITGEYGSVVPSTD